MLIIGDALEETGLAGALQVATRDTMFKNNKFPSSDSERTLAKYHDMLAKVLIEYITANADVVIKTTDVGLQTVGLVPTEGPLTDVTLVNALR